MRTTLTIDDDIAGVLRRRADELGRPFKEVVNAALRQGLGSPIPEKKIPKICARNLGLKPGIDPDRLNQLLDELDVAEFARRHRP